MKKIVSLVLAVMMLVSVVPTVYAAAACPECEGDMSKCPSCSTYYYCAACDYCPSCGYKSSNDESTSASVKGNWGTGTAVTYTATGSEAYTVTVPAELAPGASGTVTLEGTWSSDRKVTVSADANVVLTNSINAADTKTLDVTFAGIEQVGDNTESKTYTETVAVAEMPEDALFGTWSGKFNYNVEVGNAA